VNLSHRPIPRDRFDLVADVSVREDQLAFSGSVADAFAESGDEIDFHGIFLGDQAVGFYKIDTRYERIIQDRLAPLLGLRAFMIDQREQGKGLATRAVLGLAGYLAPLYPDYDALWLTVNLKNPAAIRCYLKGGFADTGEIFPHGAAGPQHILRLGFGTAC